MEIDIRLDSFNKTYNAGDNILGTLNITSSEKQFSFNHMSLTVIVYFLSLTIQGSYTIKNTKVNPPAVSIIKFYLKKQKIADVGNM